MYVTIINNNINNNNIFITIIIIIIIIIIIVTVPCGTINIANFPFFPDDCGMSTVVME